MGKEGNQLERSEDQHSESISICILKREYFSMDSSFLLYEREKEIENISIYYQTPRREGGSRSDVVHDRSAVDGDTSCCVRFLFKGGTLEEFSRILVEFLGI